MLEPSPPVPDASPPSMGRRVLAGSLWIFLLRIFKQVIFLGRAVVLARLLTPRDFGLVGIGELAIMLLGVLTYTGVWEALVVKPNPSPRFVHTAWWLNLGRSTVIALALYGLAPFLAAQFQEPAAVAVIRVLALGQWLTGFTSLGITLLYKDLQFRPLFKFEAWGTVLDFLVAVAAAFWWRNVWALVLGTLAGIITRVIASYLLYPGRPQFTFDFQAARQLLGFGRWILLSGLAYFLLSRGTESLSGIFFGAAALGLYQMAARFALIPVHHFGEVFIGALFPALSLIQGDPEKLRGVFVKGLQAGAAIIFPLAILIAFILAPLLPRVLGSQWQGVVPLAQVLSLGGAVQALLRTGPPLFLAAGRPEWQFYMDLTAAAGVGLLLLPLSRAFGLEGLTWAYALGIMAGLPVWWRLIRRQCGLSARQLLVSLIPSLAAAILMGLGLGLGLRLGPATFWGSLGAGTLGAAGYLGLLILGEKLWPDFKPLSSLLNLIFPGTAAPAAGRRFADG